MKKYILVCFENENKNGFSVDYTQLRAAFYHLNNCVQSGLYKTVIFRIIDGGKNIYSDTPVLIAKNKNIDYCDGLTAAGKQKYKYYYNNFMHVYGGNYSK